MNFLDFLHTKMILFIMSYSCKIDLLYENHSKEKFGIIYRDVAYIVNIILKFKYEN